MAESLSERLSFEIKVIQDRIQYMDDYMSTDEFKELRNPERKYYPHMRVALRKHKDELSSILYGPMKEDLSDW